MTPVDAHARRRPILCVASAGGHLAQLRLIVAGLPDDDLAWVVARAGGTAPAAGEIAVPDANARQPLAALAQAGAVIAAVWRVRPRLVISTGASVGVWALLAAWLLRRETVWIDSVANRERMSLSGRLVRPFCRHWLTQSETVAARSGARYVGNVLQ